MSILLIILGALTRIIPHPYNFTAVGAIALFTGANLKKGNYWIPFAIMLITDVILGFHSTMPYVYCSFALTIFIGYLIKSKQNIITIPLASLSTSIIFFLVTNYGAWSVSLSTYPHTFEGLIVSYIAGIPFFKNTVLGDLVYTTAIFSTYQISIHGFSIKQLKTNLNLKKA